MSLLEDRLSEFVREKKTAQLELERKREGMFREMRACLGGLIWGAGLVWWWQLTVAVMGGILLLVLVLGFVVAWMEHKEPSS